MRGCLGRFGLPVRATKLLSKKMEQSLDGISVYSEAFTVLLYDQSRHGASSSGQS